jgi:hypothetical protein
MAAQKPLGSTGKATVIKQGHTEGTYGTSSTQKARGQSSRDLTVK